MKLEQLISLLQDMPEPEPVFYRLYHDSNGNPLFYSMADVPGTYVEIDQDTYANNSMRVKVISGKLIEVTWKTVDKLVPSDTGTSCHTRDVSVVVNYDSKAKWSKKSYVFN